MLYSTSRFLIDNIVKKTIKDIQDDPERSTRNLVDMALNFADGKFQKQFLTLAQTMLKNENSSYYRLVPDIVSNVDHNKIRIFGMNIGYNSCTYGANLIREHESTKGFNIPWFISLAISGEGYLKKKELYDSLISHGERLGIYTWLIFSEGKTEKIMPLIEKNPDHAFVLFTKSQEINNQVIDYALHVDNLMFALEMKNGVEDTCSILRKNKLLYSLYYPYEEKDLEEIKDGTLILDAEVMNPAFIGFLPKNNCPFFLQEGVYKTILDFRNKQLHRTIPLELVQDFIYVDYVISGDPCACHFDNQGNIHFYNKGNFLRGRGNIFENTLVQILKDQFKKNSCEA